MFEYIYRRKMLWLLMGVLLGLTFQFSLDVIFSLIYRNHSLISPPGSYLFSIAITFIIMYGLVKLAGWMNQKISWEKAPGVRFYSQIIVITIFILVVVMGMRMVVIFLFSDSQFIRLTDEIIITVYFLVMALLLVFIDTGLHLLTRWRNSLAEIERFRKENLETQFEMLRMQVNPHFLFNSLNTLTSLIYQNQDTAASYVREMATVYRYILEQRKADTVKLHEEMTFVSSYMMLLSLRFEDKITFEVNISEDYNEKVVPPLTVQILIENAVKHNVASLRKPLRISISTRPDNTLVVSNNLQPKTDPGYSTGIGLHNLKSRLALLTDRPATVTKTDDTFAVAIPLLDARHNKLINW
jgi:sensor histidine kinase YesM